MRKTYVGTIPSYIISAVASQNVTNEICLACVKSDNIYLKIKLNSFKNRFYGE